MKTIFAAIVALFLTAGAAFAEPNEVENQIKPAVSFAKAMNIATGTEDGELVSLELDHYDEVPIYVAELKGNTAHSVIRIDGTSGKVLATSTTSAASPEALHAMLQEQDHQEHDDCDDHDDAEHGDEH